MHRFSLFFKGGWRRKAIPISDNSQKGGEISDEFHCHLKYKHYFKQKTFENFREVQQNNVKRSIFLDL